jgi:plastocyanin
MLRGKILNRSAVWLLVIAQASALAILPVHCSVDNFALFGSASKGWGFTTGSIASPGPTTTVAQNDVVNLTLTSVDGLQHKFFIDYNGNGIPDADEPTSVPFTTTTSLLINASVAGTFKYFCAFHPNIMYGTFTVTNESTHLVLAVNVSAVSFTPATFLAIGATVALVVIAATVSLVIMIDYIHSKHRRK